MPIITVKKSCWFKMVANFTISLSNEVLGMPSGRIEFEVAELKKELSTVDKELESMATASDDDEKLALPAKFS